MMETFLPNLLKKKTKMELRPSSQPADYRCKSSRHGVAGGGRGSAMKDGVRWRQMIGCADPRSDGLREEVDCALDADGATRRISLSAGILTNT